MKLTIKNYKKIEGTYEKLHIISVYELSDRYVFNCSRRGGNMGYQLYLSREGRKDPDGDWIYHFHNGQNESQSVTPDWFENMGNAVSAVISEFDSQYHL